MCLQFSSVQQGVLMFTPCTCNDLYSVSGILCAFSSHLSSKVYSCSHHVPVSGILCAFSSHLSSKVYSCSVPSVLTCPARCTHVRASLFTQWLVSISNNPLPLSKVSVSHYCTFCALHQYCIQRRTTFSCGRSLDSAWSLMVMSALVLLSLFPCCTTFHSVRL